MIPSSPKLYEYIWLHEFPLGNVWDFCFVGLQELFKRIIL